MPPELLTMTAARRRRRREVLEINPRYALMLDSLGLASLADFLNLDGPILSGHPDRHVVRVTLGGRDCYLKREHRVRLRHRLANLGAGFGFRSVSVRESRLLTMLQEAGIAAPEWIAAGEAADGRAFLLLDNVGCSDNLRQFLTRRPPRDRRSRRRLARRLAGGVAQIHQQGFTYPDLYAKHILIEGAGGGFTFLDWQRSRRRRRLTWVERSRDLAALNASLTDELADADDRLTFLLTYWRAVRDDSISFRKVCQRIQRRTQKLLRRSSIHEQRSAVVADSQPLYWIDGEKLCLSAAGRDLDPARINELGYPASAGAFESRTVSISGRSARLTVRRTVRRFGKLLDALRGRRWQSPECRHAAQLLREERLGRPCRLLAFGQFERSWGCVDSFLLETEEVDAVGDRSCGLA